MKVFFVLIFLVGHLFTFKVSSSASFWGRFGEICRSSGLPMKQCGDERMQIKRLTRNKVEIFYYFKDYFKPNCNAGNFDNCVSSALDYAQCMADAGWFARTSGSPCG